MSVEQIELAKTLYDEGKDAFERGQYRRSVECLEKAVSLLARGTTLRGEVQLWLVMAYDAAGQQQEAIALCEQVTKHPHSATRKQASQLLYILKAPRLQTRPEWLTQIPDLTNLDNAETGAKGAYEPKTPRPPRRPRPKPEPDLEPIDLSQVNTKDNGFIWVALVAIALLLGSLIWLSM